MPCTSAFVTKPLSVSLCNGDTSSLRPQSKNDRVHFSVQHGTCTPNSTQRTASAYNYVPPSASSDGRSLPERAYINQSSVHSTASLDDRTDQGEESDYFHESTPGRAWKRTEQAVPRVRVIGFNVSTSYTSKSGASESQPGHPPNKSTPVSSGPSRRSDVPERSGIFRGQNVQLVSDKSCSSHGAAASIPQRRSDVCKHPYTHGSDVRRKTMAKAN